MLKRRTVREQSLWGARRWPWWAKAGLGVLALMSVGSALALGAVFAVYASYARDYQPIEQYLGARWVGQTEVYDRGGPDGGVYLGHLANPYGQVLHPVPLEEISPYMIEATISTEDNTFWEHPGVNPRGIFRAAVENYVGGGIGSGTGGSSITQQLVKNVYLMDDCEEMDGVRVCTAPRTLDRKVREIAYAFELESDYTKAQILNWYLNQISYADRYVGVEAAAQGYFRKSAKDLTLAEAALLAGIPSAPTEYHPRLNCVTDDAAQCVLDAEGRATVGGAAKERQESVLRLMVEHRRTTAEEAEAAIATPLLIYPPAAQMLAPAWIDNQVQPRLVRMCEAGILRKTPGTASCEESVAAGGYKVTSTLNWGETERARQMANIAVANGQQAGCRCNNAAIATIEPATGQVVVYAPNIDHTWTSDRRVAGEIDQLMEVNQPGSAFKPFVYLAWMDRLNKTPMSTLWDTSPMSLRGVTPNSTVDDGVVITNPRPGGGGEGLITARAALGGSQNVGAFRAAHEAGLPNVIQVAKAMGFTTLEQNFDPTFYNHAGVGYGPAIATGGANLRAIDMAYADATIANLGTMVGVARLAPEVPLKEFKSLLGAEGDAYQEAYAQKLAFTRGNIRLEGTRLVDPVTILRVQSIDGEVLYEHGADLQKVQVMDAGSVWMLHSIMSDCTARFIIWGCGSSNNDLGLDFFMADGTKVPGGIKTGTQQGPRGASDTLETWMTGYSRYAGTAVWVGNADNSLVYDGAFAAANTTVRLFKNWMGTYHDGLKQAGRIPGAPAGFADVQPKNVVLAGFQSATTERGARGGCSQTVQAWQRTDVTYTGDCVGGGMPLPALRPDLAAALARQKGIPVRTAAGVIQTAPPPQPTIGVLPVATPTPLPPTPVLIQPTPTAGQSQPTPVPTVQSQGGGNGNGNNGRGNGRGR